VRRLRERLEVLAAGARPADGALAELADLEVAHEELQVAQEELRVQQEQIAQLLTRYESERRWRGQLAALVPVGLAVTDGNGKLVDANPAMAGVLGLGLHRLRGKPLTLLVGREEVGALRGALRALASGAAAESRILVTLHPRDSQDRHAELFGFADIPATRATDARVQWVLVVDDGMAAVPAPFLTGVGLGGGSTPEGRGATDVLGLAAAFAGLTALPVADEDRQRMLRRMSALVQSAVPGASWVSITLGSPQDPQRLGADSREALEFDGLQVRAEEGPCWEAFRTTRIVICDEVEDDDRWPVLRGIAGERQVRSVLAIPVVEAGESIGVLNLYGREPSAFGAANRRIGELAAAAVTGVLQNVAEREALRDLAANLERALTSRAVIDQAKGVIMARLGVTADDAFTRLVTLSSRMNVKLRDLARLVVEGEGDAVLGALD
jgi:PAS domain S-box-containing protein